MLNRYAPQMAFAVAVLCSVLIAPTAAVAQEFSASDTREIASYLLTDAGLAKYTQATENLGPLAEQMSASCDSESGEDAQSLDQLAAVIESTPGAGAAIQSAGMTPREYVVFTLSLLQNALAAWVAGQPGGQLPPGTVMANVNFYRSHEAALQALGEQIQGADCDSGDEDEEALEDEP